MVFDLARQAQESQRRGQYHHAVAGGSPDFRFPIVECRLALLPDRNRQLSIGNQETHPLPRGGTDLTPRQSRIFEIPC
jgi:hypothetical protein